MLLLQELAEVLDALRLADVQLAESDGGVSAILGQHLGLLELRVVVQCVDGFSPALC